MLLASGEDGEGGASGATGANNNSASTGTSTGTGTGYRCSNGGMNSTHSTGGQRQLCVFVYAATGPASIRQTSVRPAGRGNGGDEGDEGDNRGGGEEREEREEGEERGDHSDLTFAEVCAWRNSQDFFPSRV